MMDVILSECEILQKRRALCVAPNMFVVFTCMLRDFYSHFISVDVLRFHTDRLMRSCYRVLLASPLSLFSFLGIRFG